MSSTALCPAVVRKTVYSKTTLNLRYELPSEKLVKIAEGRHFLVVHHLQEIKVADIVYFLPDTPITCKVDNMEKHNTQSKVNFFILYGNSVTFFILVV